MDIVGLQHPAHIRLISRPDTQALERSFLVAKRRQKRKRKSHSIKGLPCKLSNGLFDFNRVHGRFYSHSIVAGGLLETS